jgi:hypothetical protein
MDKPWNVETEWNPQNSARESIHRYRHKDDIPVTIFLLVKDAEKDSDESKSGDPSPQLSQCVIERI